MIGSVSEEELRNFDDAPRIFARWKPCCNYNLQEIQKLGKPIARIEATHNRPEAVHAATREAGVHVFVRRCVSHVD